MDPHYTDRFLASFSPAAAKEASDPEAVMHTAYTAVVRGDYETFRASLTEDVELNIHGFGPMNGTWRGPSDVVAATRNNFALVEAQKPEMEGTISRGDSVAVLFREQGVFKSSGESYSIRCVQWFTIANGKIRRIDEIVAATGV